MRQVSVALMVALLVSMSSHLAAQPVAAGAAPERPDPRPPIRPYIRGNNHRVRDAAKHGSRAKWVFAVEKSNTAASVDDLRYAHGPVDSLEVEVDPSLPPPPTLPEQLPQPEFPGEQSAPLPQTKTEPFPDWSIPPQIADSKLPMEDDGLAGNRQLALTPFPNLNIQSGPLAKHQLPWTHRFEEERPFSMSRSLEFQSAVGFVESNGGDDAEFGWYNSGVVSAPFWKEKGIGVQLAGTFEPTTFPQILLGVGAGAFRRAIWTDDAAESLIAWNRVSWGMGFDGLFDSENGVFLGQQRTQLGYAMAPNREIGLWFALPLGDQIAHRDGYLPVAMQTSALVSFYYRHVWASELDGTFLMGATEQPGGFHSGGYLSYRVSAQLGCFMQGIYNSDENAGFSFYAGVRIYFHPLDDYSQISGNPLNRYRAYMPVPDHINLQVRKTAP